jgi:hypothetical protein
MEASSGPKTISCYLYNKPILVPWDQPLVPRLSPAIYHKLIVFPWDQPLTPRESSVSCITSLYLSHGTYQRLVPRESGASPCLFFGTNRRLVFSFCVPTGCGEQSAAGERDRGTARGGCQHHANHRQQPSIVALMWP